MMTRKRLGGAGAVLLLTGLLAALLIGCSENEYVTQPPVGEGVGPDGGTVTSTDGDAQVVIPPGALDQVVEVIVEPASQPPTGSVPGTAYIFSPDGTQFTLPVSITIAYDHAGLPGGTSPQDLQLCQAVGGTWVPLAIYTVDDQAHALTGPTTHFSSYGIVIDDGGPTESSTAYLTDSPDPQNPGEFDNLVEAMEWLESILGVEDQGILVWQTSTVQQVESLAYSFDWMIDVEEGAEPAIEGPTGAPLVIDAGGAIDLSAFAITAPMGLVVNANRAIHIASCDLPGDVLVNVGGVKGAPFPAGDSGYVAKSDLAEKLSRGMAVTANRVANFLNVQIGGAESVSSSITVTENQTSRLVVGGPAVLVPDVTLTVGGPISIPVPYPNINTNLGGNSQAVIKNFQGSQRLVTKMNCTGHNLITVRDIDARVHIWDVSGSGTPVLKFLDSTADSASILAAGSTVDLELSGVTNQSGMFVHSQDVAGNVDVLVDGGAFGGGLQVNLPEGGNTKVELNGSTHSGGQLVIGSGGGSSSQINGGPAAVKLTDLIWSGSVTSDHIDIFGIESPVNITGGTFTHSGTPAVILGLTEISGAITIEDATFNGAGIGLVDCTGTTTISGADITMTTAATYGVSMGGCAAVTIEDCSIIGASGGIGVIQTGEMNGNVTITGCSLDGAAAAVLATFAGSSVTMDNNPLLSGRIFIIESQVHLSGNTFSAAEVWDDYNSPGLQNDPVQDNDGLLPGMCYTRMDWDGNGCCDYPPEWNATDEFGACTVCQGVAGKVLSWR